MYQYFFPSDLKLLFFF